MQKIITPVLDGQVQDIPLGIAGDMVQGIRCINESPLECDVVFGDYEDTVEAWKWASYPGNSTSAKVHVESNLLPGAAAGGPSSVFVILVYAKGEKMPMPSSGALVRQVSQNQQELIYLYSEVSPCTISPAAVLNQKFHLVGFIYTGSNAAATAFAVDVSLNFNSLPGASNTIDFFDMMEANEGRAYIRFDAPNDIHTKRNDGTGSISAGATPANVKQSLLVWGYYA